MKPLARLITALLLLAEITVSAKEPSGDCQLLHQGTFTYGAKGSEVIVKINGKQHIEYHNGGKYTIESELDWVSDCEYNMTLLKISIPDFPYKPGDVMNVTIDRVSGNEIYYTSTVNGQRWKGKFTRIE